MTLHRHIQRMPDGLEMYAGPTTDQPPASLDLYHRGFARAFQAAPEMLHWIPRDTLVEPKTKLALFVGQSGAHAGFLYTLTSDQSARTIRVRGLFNDGHRRGLGQVLVARVVMAESRVFGSPLAGSAAIRVLPDGRTNLGSAIALGRLGFVPSQLVVHRILGTASDAHLADTAEPDGISYRSLELVAKPADLLRRARSVLGQADPWRHDHD